MRAYSPDADLELLRRAYVFSAFEHKGQVRHSGEPYLVHPLEVADFLADLKLDVVAIAAGLLHDVVEDTLTTHRSRSTSCFGPEVAHVVEGVTKIGAIPFSSSEERQAENFRKMLLAMVDDIRVILVKLADRLHNMRTLHHLPEERRVKIAQETLDIYAPIANRLGMSKVKNELEELSFKYLEPKYVRIAAGAGRGATEGDRRAHRRAEDDARAEARRGAGAGRARSTGASSVSTASHQKLKKQKIELEQVYDFVALRVLTTSVKDCYAALGIIHQTVVAGPGPHQGLHRDAAAERLPVAAHLGHQRARHAVRGADPDARRCTTRRRKGIAAHWKYKEGRVGDQRDERYFQWMRQLLEWQQEVRDPQEFIQNLRSICIRRRSTPSRRKAR